MMTGTDDQAVLLVAKPRKWWFAQRGDMTADFSNPEEVEGKRPHVDRDVRWPAIVAMVEHVGQQIQARGSSVEEGEPLEVWFDQLRGGLSKSEWDVVTGWFSGVGWGVVCGPVDGILDGRHRLWETFNAVPDATVPVLDSVLTVNRGDDPEIKQAAATEIGGRLNQLSEEFLRRNAAYIQELESLRQELLSSS